MPLLCVQVIEVCFLNYRYTIMTVFGKCFHVYRLREALVLWGGAILGPRLGLGLCLLEELVVEMSMLTMAAAAAAVGVRGVG